MHFLPKRWYGGVLQPCWVKVQLPSQTAHPKEKHTCVPKKRPWNAQPGHWSSQKSPSLPGVIRFCERPAWKLQESLMPLIKFWSKIQSRRIMSGWTYLAPYRRWWWILHTGSSVHSWNLSRNMFYKNSLEGHWQEAHYLQLVSVGTIKSLTA